MGKVFKQMFFMIIGAIIVGVTIEGFLVPNQIIDGGILGISIMSAYIAQNSFHLPLSLGIFTFVLNLPFLIIAIKRMGIKFMLRALTAVSVMSATIYLAEKSMYFTRATETPILACLFGGIFLGLGVGLVLRNSACLDGTEVLALLLTKKTGYSVGEIVMFFNVFIFTIAGFVYDWDNAMYSILTYFFAYKTIDIVLEGINESKSIWIISDLYQEIGTNIMKEFDTSVTYIPSYGGYSGMEKMITYCVISRLEIGKLKDNVKSIDPNAFISIENVHEVEGKRINKKK